MTHREYLALRRFPALTGLRAIAAIMVIFFHDGGAVWAPLSGWLGVHIFFVLSGYLITTLALREEAVRGRVSLAGFYVRRIFRIMPPYFAVLAVSVVVLALRDEFRGSPTWINMPSFLSFNSDLVVGGGFMFGHTWTMGIEQKFYLFWPLLMFAFVGMRWRYRVGIAILLILIAMPFSPTSSRYFGVHYMVILVGCLLALVLHHPGGFAAMRWLTHPAVAVAVVLAFVCVQYSMRPFIAYLGGAEAPAVALYAIPVSLLIVALLGRNPFAWALGTRPMEFIGDRSYSLYLLQSLAVLTVAAVIPRAGSDGTRMSIFVTIVALAFADLMYRWVELPCIAAGRWTADRINRRHAPAPSPEVAVNVGIPRQVIASTAVHDHEGRRPAECAAEDPREAVGDSWSRSPVI